MMFAGVLTMAMVGLAQAADVRVEDAWSRPTIAGHTGVVYLTVQDAGAPDTLTGASTPIASQAELHESFVDHGVAKMRAVRSLPVGPDKPVTLAPNGYHIMLMGLKQPLKAGDTFPVTLTFANAGSIAATVTVRGSDSAMSHTDMSGMNMAAPTSHKTP
jgi:periplasmic copper chaperone A